MDIFFYFLIPIALGAVLVVLGLGIVNMARGGSPERSQKLMQMRVLFQLGAVVILLLTLYLMSP